MMGAARLTSYGFGVLRPIELDNSILGDQNEAAGAADAFGVLE
jgi:hypothetical protein